MESFPRAQKWDALGILLKTNAERTVEIAFDWRYNLIEFIEARENHSLAPNDWDPAWSPDDANIAFTSGRDGYWDIYVMNADGSDQTRLTNNSGWDLFPDWSPE